MKAVQFGAGNIGRGFLGQLFAESGYDIVFVDVDDHVVDAINERGSYPIRIVGEHAETITIDNVRAVHGLDMDGVAMELAACELAATAVGVNALPKVAPVLAAGIAKRLNDSNASPLNILICENLLDASTKLRGMIGEHLPSSLHDLFHAKIGLVEASIGRMVPVMTEDQRADEPLLVCVEAYCELPVDQAGFRGAIPPLAHMKPLEKFGGYVERKLFMHNMSHAVAAYLGHLRGHEYIWQAMDDSYVLEQVRGALGETAQGLHRKHGLDLEGLRLHGEDLMRRYRNRALGDRVDRVARDPVRKLGRDDRLIGALRMCLEQGVIARHIAFAAAAAMHYHAPDVPGAATLAAVRDGQGISGILREICDIEPDSGAGRLVLENDRRLREEGWFGQEVS